MRVLIVHNRYQHLGGEDVMAEAERDLLRRHGHHVESLMFSNEGVERMGGIRMGLASLWNRQGADAVTRRAVEGRFDLVHFHNLLLRVSPAAIRSVHAAGVATVHTLHNFRHLCAAASLHRDGHNCTDCVGHIGLPAVRHRCYRGNRAATIALVGGNLLHHTLGTWTRCVDAFITHTPAHRELFAAGGMPREKLHVVGNFVEPDPGPATEAGLGVLYVGRLVEEKGVRTLLRAAPHFDMPLTVIGDGPLRPEVEAAGPSVRYRGEQPRSAVLDAMRRAAVVVVPSEWHEMFPLTILEAFASGRPVVASGHGAMREMVQDGRTGRLFAVGEPAALAAAVNETLGRPDWGVAARAAYLQYHHGEPHVRLLEGVYRAALAEAERRRPMVSQAAPVPSVALD